VCALPGDPQLLGDVGDRSAVIEDPLYEQPTTIEVQTSISVGHEDLLGWQRRQTSPLSREVLLVHKTQTVTNVPAEYI
jgi:hypothetical protein